MASAWWWSVAPCPTAYRTVVVASLVAAAHARGAQVIVDTHGPALLEALAAGADVVKPNADELAEAHPGDDPVTAARGLSETYGATVVASLGADGVVAVGPTGAWQARPATPVTGNPTGAGDALVAGLARALDRDPRRPPTTRGGAARRRRTLRRRGALPEAGDVDPAHHAAELSGVQVRALDGAR